MIRVVRYVDDLRLDDEVAFQGWLERITPRGAGERERLILLSADADRLNKQYEQTFDALGRARLDDSAVLALAIWLPRIGDAALAWLQLRRGDRYARLRAAERPFSRVRRRLEKSGARLHPSRTILLAPRSVRILQAAWEMGKGVSAGAIRDVGMDSLVGRSTGGGAQVDLGPFIQCLRTAGRGPFLHRSAMGPFIYPRSIDRQRARPDLFVNGLLFGAVLEARRATAPDLAPLSRGCPMPVSGRPLWPVAVALVRDVAGEDIGEKEARDRLTNFIRRNTGVGFMGWPTD